MNYADGALEVFPNLPRFNKDTLKSAKPLDSKRFSAVRVSKEWLIQLI